MSLPIERARTKKRVTWLTIIGVILLPVLIGGVLVTALWNPTDRLDQIRAAIVNNDEAVTVNGQLAPLGRQLTAGLVEGSDDVESNIDWVISNTEDAKAGLADGTYQAAITIPKGFSAAATSTGGDDPHQATIDVRTAPDAKVFDDVITNQIASIATATMGSSLSEVYVETVLQGFTTLNDELGTAASGADELADGAKQSADGTSELADGATQLADGAGQAAAGTQQLAAGSSELATGAGGLADGAHQLSDGLGQLAPGAGALADGTQTLAGSTGAFATGVADLSGGLDQLAAGSRAAVDGLQGFEDTVRANASATADSQMVPQELLTNAADAAAGSLGLVQTLVGADPQNPTGLAAQLGALAQQCDPAVSGAEFCQQLGAAAATAGDAAAAAGGLAVSAGTANGYADGLAKELPGQVAAGLTSIADGLTQMRVGTDEQPGGLEALASNTELIAQSTHALVTGAQGIDSGVQQLNAGAGSLRDGLSATSAGASSLAGGASTLADGTWELADGASALSSGASSLATGTQDLADGATKLSSGIGQLSDGTKELASGLGTAVDSIPSYTDTQRTSIASVVANPVTTSAGATSTMFGGSAIPLLAVLALWFGALASYVVIQAVSRRSLASRAPSALLALKSFIPGAAIGAVQGVLLSVIVQFATKYDAGQWLAFAGLAALAGIAFAAVNQALVALFGGAGRWISALVGVMFFATGVVSTTPGVLASIADALPTGPAFHALLTVVTSAGGAGAAITSIVIWLLAGLLATTVAVARRRSTSAKLVVAS